MIKNRKKLVEHKTRKSITNNCHGGGNSGSSGGSSRGGTIKKKIKRVLNRSNTCCKLRAQKGQLLSISVVNCNLLLRAAVFCQTKKKSGFCFCWTNRQQPAAVPRFSFINKRKSKGRVSLSITGPSAWTALFFNWTGDDKKGIFSPVLDLVRERGRSLTHTICSGPSNLKRGCSTPFSFIPFVVQNNPNTSATYQSLYSTVK
jgi:hypothetical protein